MKDRPRLWQDPLFWLPIVTFGIAAVLFGLSWREYASPAPIPDPTPTPEPSDPAALALLQQMEFAMNQLKTLKTVEVMRDDSGNSLTMTMEYAAPDGLRLTTGPGAEYISLGVQQWAHTEDEILWSTWPRPQPVPFPNFHDSQTAVDVQLGTETALDGQAVQVVTYVLAGFEGRFDYKVYADHETLRFLRVTMDGSGHHMVTDYVDYAPTVVITPPPPDSIAPTPTAMTP